MDFLEELFTYQLNQENLDLTQVPGYHARAVRLSRCYEQLHQSMGLDFVDRLNGLEGEQRYQENLACFRHGFRLAGQLFWELRL
ncbi:DUF6809 family protein [Flavonifractor sp. An306]|uniref:DUF6809 family protein n=1 Tax=Flavonifractor sp. An306 TaxID=1965629 RepID=UPI001FA82BD5|nr:DUF6809 family protein [Flavonifractor sp. An306]